MKTIVTLIPVITRMLETAEYAVDALLNAINAMANDTTVTAKQGDLKRSAMKLKAKGKEIAWSESDKTEYVAPACAPLAFNAWHDAMANVFKAHGDPAGELTPDVIPSGLRLWLDMTFSKSAMSKKAERKAAKATGGNGRGITPGKGGKRNVPQVPETPVAAGSETK